MKVGNVNAKFYKLNMLGVPVGWRAFCTRGYSDRLANLEFEYMIAKAWAKDVEPLFVIYGGGRQSQLFAQEHNCIYITPLALEKKKLENFKQIAQAGAFFNEEFSMKALSSQTGYDRMVHDFRNDQQQIEDKINHKALI